MKRLITIALATLMVLTLFACGKSTGSQENMQTNDTKNTEAAALAADDKQGNTQNSETQSSQDKPASEQGSRVLVAYFSATNTTAGVAKNIADGIGADIYEITPETPYTSADLNYNDKKSRSTVEMNNADARPAIAGSVDNIEQYDVIFLGYPIWWGEAPRIIDTFLESYDFSGKTIVPFCTSASSGVGSSVSNIRKLAGNATWTDGHRFSGSDSADTIMKWVDSLGLKLGK